MKIMKLYPNTKYTIHQWDLDENSRTYIVTDKILLIKTSHVAYKNWSSNKSYAKLTDKPQP